MKFDPKFLDQLRSRLAISEVVGDSVSLKKKGREYLGLCPFHKEKTPSFTVNDEKAFYHCFGCGAHGDVVRFYVDHRGYSFFDAVKELAGRAGLALPEERDGHEHQKVDNSLYTVMEEAGKWFHEQLFSHSASEAQTYLERRGFTPDHVKDLQLGFAPRGRHALKQVLLQRGFPLEVLTQVGLLVSPDEGGDPYDRFRGRIMFPIHDLQGRLVAFGGRILGEGEPKYLNSPETPIFSKGHMLYGYHHARTHMKKGDPVIVAEGYMDVIALRKAGYVGALAPMGTALTEDQISLLWRLSFEPILCFDGDQAGQKAAQRAADRALPLLRPGYTLKFAHLPQGEDPDTMVRSGRKAQLSQLLSQGEPLLNILWTSLAQGKDLKAPEQQALLLKEIDQLTKRAENSTVASTFRAALKDRFYQLRNRGRLVKKSSIKLTRPLSFLEKSNIILLAISIRHPHVLEEVSEQLACLEIDDENLGRIKDAILDYAAQDEPYSEEALLGLLSERGLSRNTRELLEHDVVQAFPSSKSEAGNDAALEDWNEVHRGILRYQLEEEVQRLQSQLAKEMTDENWRRLLEVKKMLQEPC